MAKDNSGSDPKVTVEDRGAIRILRFDNAPSGLVTTKGAARIADAIEGAIADPAVRGVVLTGGQPGVFIRHADVAQIARAADAVAEGRIEPASFADTPFRRLCDLLDRAEKPVVAAIDGICMGGGLEIALACTMRVASPISGPIGLPEIRIDIFPGAGGTQRLAGLIGRHRARLFMLAGATVGAQEAHALGIVDSLATDPVAHAVTLAEGFARRAPSAIAAILRLTADPDASDRIDRDMTAFGTLVGAERGIRERLRHFVNAGEQLDLLD